MNRNDMVEKLRTKLVYFFEDDPLNCPKDCLYNEAVLLLLEMEEAGLIKELEPEDKSDLKSNIPKCDFCSSPCGFDHCSAKNDKGSQTCSVKNSVVVKPKRGR